MVKKISYNHIDGKIQPVIIENGSAYNDLRHGAVHTLTRKMPMNIYDISKLAGVSIATVSRVLNGSEKVSQKTKEKVLAVMDEVNYTPNVFARGLGLDSMKTIGIMVADASDSFLANGIYYAEEILKQSGYDAILNCSGYDYSGKKKALELLMSKRIDGLIMIGSMYIEPNEKDRQYLYEASETIPIAIVNGYMDGNNIYCAYCDDFQAVYDATGQLLDSGREKILFLHRSLSYSARQKMSGYRAAFAKHGLEVNEDHIILMDRDIDKAKEKLNLLYDAGLRFDAIVATHDRYAAMALKFARDKGLSVPEDLSIIGYDNTILSVCTNPEITSIDSKVSVTTTEAVNALLKALDGQTPPKKICIPGELIKRETTDF